MSTFNNKKNVLWVHNYSSSDPNSGTFMWHSLKAFGINKNYAIESYFLNTRKNNFSKIKEMYKLRSIARNYNIIHVQYGSLVFALTVLSLLGMKKRIIVTLRGSDINRLKIAPSREFIHSFMATSLTLCFLRFVSDVITVSKKIAKKIRHKRVTVIPSPISEDFFEYSLSNTLSGSHKHILFSAITPESSNKRLTLAQASINEYNKTYNGTLKLTIISKESPKNVVNKIAASDLILLTSMNEGWPNIIKEGLAMGKPFVSTNVSDLDIVVADLDFKCKISKPNQSDIAQNIDRILKEFNVCNDSKTLRIYARQFSKEQFVLKTKDVYDENIGAN